MKMVGDNGQSTRHGRSTELEVPRSLLGRFGRSEHKARESMSVDDCRRAKEGSSVGAFE